MKSQIDMQIVKLWTKWFLEKREGTFHRFLKLGDEMQLAIVKNIDVTVNNRV